MIDKHLGQKSAYKQTYDASLLEAVPRSLNRDTLTYQHSFFGVDRWTGYEVSWLRESGRPEVAIAFFEVPSDSPNLIESKSFKLYLNSFNQTKLSSIDELISRLQSDLTAVAGADVVVKVEYVAQVSYPVQQFDNALLIDDACDQGFVYTPDIDLLETLAVPTQGVERFQSHLLKSNCLVTGQPDWGSVLIEYQASQRVSEASLLRYIVAFRDHQEFHEHCVERIYTDLYQTLQPDFLCVSARYTRRGGLDINPVRCSSADRVDWHSDQRLVRQ